MIEKNLPQIFKSEGDYEAAILYENVRAFSSIINKDLYEVVGNSSHSEVRFHHRSAFDLFCVYVFELLVESIEPEGVKEKHSLFSGARWVANKYKKNIDVNGLEKAIDVLDNWLKEKKTVSFYSGELSKQIGLKLTRRQMLYFAQIFTKHNLFRSTRAIADLHKRCNKHGCEILE